MIKKKIAVIGGGLGSLSTIYHLMQQPDAVDKYDITLYQLGWRLGGKGASGVNREQHQRVEEHGIHFWFGFYENAFALMKAVYAGLGRPPGAPLATFHEAFHAQPYMVFAEKIGRHDWTDFQANFPNLPGEVGDGQFISPVEEIMAGIFNSLADEVSKHLGPSVLHAWHGLWHRLKTGFGWSEQWENPLEKLVRNTEQRIQTDVAHDLEKHLRLTGQFLSDSSFHTPENLAHHLDNFAHLRHWIWDLIGHLVENNINLLRLWSMVDFFLALVHGVMNDGVLKVKDGKLAFDFECINQFDFDAWLQRNGADERLLSKFPPIKSMYDGPFAFFKGNVGAPEVEAGTVLNVFLRLAFACKEHVVWRMMAGMGDTVFAPIYQLLKKEFPDNVHFEFFHKAENLALSADRQLVETITFNRQVKLKEGLLAYEPLFDANGLPCWPAAPLYEQLDPAQAERLRAEGINLESSWSGWDGGEPLTLQRGVDFDEVIIGASLAALPDMCCELMDQNPAWMTMLDAVGSVQTQAFQIWLTKDAKELGVAPQKVLSCYVEPLDTFAEMNQALAFEKWGDEAAPRYVAYVCGAFAEAESLPPYHAHAFAKSQSEEAFENMKAFVQRDLRHILPDAFDAQGEFDWNLLVDPENRSGPERLRAQYWRANIDPTERYVFSLPGSSRRRLGAGESGFANVFLTGDWIQNGINIGCVEGATVSGILTARAVAGSSGIALYSPW